MKMPVVSGKETVEALSKVDFYIRRRKGSHMILRKDKPFAQVTVPDHKELDRGTLKSILKGANLSVEEFIELLD